MEAQAQGLLETEPLQGRDEDTVASADFSSMLSEEEREELKAELVQLEDEITTLRQVLSAKERHLVEIKQKLGMNLMNELKQNFSRSWYDVQTTTAYKKTHETLSHAGQKATAAFSNVGTAISKKFGDMRYSPSSLPERRKKRREWELNLGRMSTGSWEHLEKPDILLRFPGIPGTHRT
nr:tumor protein D53 isoform X3 [Mirounga angustirostris]